MQGATNKVGSVERWAWPGRARIVWDPAGVTPANVKAAECAYGFPGAWFNDSRAASNAVRMSGPKQAKITRVMVRSSASHR